MADVHIVSVPEDEAKAKALANMFERAGFSIGDAAPDDSQLRSMGAGVVVWSSAAIHSHPFVDAAQRVIKSGKAVVAYLTEPLLPASIGNLPAFDLSGWSGDPDDPVLDPLFFAVDRMVKAQPASAAPAAPFLILGDVALPAPKPRFGDGALPFRKPALTPTPTKPAAAPESPPDAVSLEAELWREIRDSADPAKFKEYLAKYGPGGAFAEIAERALAIQTPAAKSAARPPLAVAKPAPVAKATPAAPVKPATKPERRLFLSHASEADSRRALKLLTALEAAGCPCWMAPRDIPSGADWNGAIISAIDACEAMILLVSGAALKSPFVKAEVQHAFEKGKRVFPIRLADSVEAGQIDLRLKIVQHIDGRGEVQAIVASVLKSLR